MAAEAVFLGRDGQQLGPYTRTNLAAMAARGEIHDSDLAWYEGLREWLPAPEVLASLAIQRMAAPPPVPPPPPPAPVVQAPPPEQRFPGGRRPDGSIHRLGDPEPEPPPGPAGDAHRAGLPAWMQDEVQQQELYEAFLGPNNKERYLALFQRFDAGEGNTSWNLAAGLISQLWMLYRGMYLWGLLLYPLLGFAAAFVFGLVVSMFGGSTGGTLSSLLWLAVTIAVPGIYGDRLYHSHARKLIERSGLMGLRTPERRAWLARKGGTNFIAPLLLLGSEVLLIGLAAAVSIPAYQSYVIRAQVTEGQVLALQAEQAVENYYGSLHAMPMDNAAARWPAPEQAGGTYVQSVEISNGTILVRYGGRASPRLAGKVLAFVAEEGSNGIHWDCATETTTLDNQYRPAQCRN